MRVWRFLFLVALGAPASLGACGTNAVGVDDCNTIEDALCRKAAAMTPACPGFDPGQPPHPGGSVSDNTAACIRFYSIACLHGLVTTKAPTNIEVNTCVDAINSLSDSTSSCSVIDSPQTAPDAACAWLVPPEAGADAEADADASDGAASADVTADVDAAVDASIDAEVDSTSDALADASKDGGAGD